MSNLVPDGWLLTTLGSNARLITDGAHASPPTCEGGKPIATVQNMLSRSIDVGSCRSISEDDFDMLVRGNCSPITGDVLFSKDGTVGKTFVYRQSDIVVLLSSIAIIRLFQDKVEPEFCSQYLLSPLFYQKLENTKSGSAIRRIVLSDLKKIELPTPPLPEQQKIAAILSSVDDVIEKTRAQIDKLKDLKTGMMQELLTKGIGHTAFKDSPVGRIPEGWEVVSLGTLASFVTSGSRGWAQYYSDSGSLFIRIGNLTREHINLRFDDCVYVSPPDSAEGKRTQVQLGDVLISITADLGVIGVVNESIGEAYVNQHVSLVRLDQPETARWVGHFLAFENSQKQFVANNDAGAKSGLNLSAIRNTLVAMPETDERQRIVEALDAVDGEIARKRQKVQHVMRMKKALMQDLLTGKVRVNVDNKENAVA